MNRPALHSWGMLLLAVLIATGGCDQRPAREVFAPTKESSAVPSADLDLQWHWAQGRLALQLVGSDTGLRVVWILPQRIEQPIRAQIDPSARFPEALLYRGEAVRFLRPSGSPEPPGISEKAVGGTLICVPEGGKTVSVTLRDIRFKDVQFHQVGPIRVELDQAAPP